MPFRIVVTDASLKHSIAIQRELRSAFGDVWLMGHDQRARPLASWHGQLDAYRHGIPLADLLRSERFDMALPVGGKSVRTVATACPERAVLPAPEALERCYDKHATTLLASSAGVAHPRTSVIRTPADLPRCHDALPCVVKPASETEAKGVTYAGTPGERDAAVLRWLDALGPGEHRGVLVQERVRGASYGLFALYDRGRAVRVFMHQRLRELPVSGGASTAARAVYEPSLLRAGLRLLDALHWHGVAMAEFKRDERTGEFVLIELNAKFWGSTELALRAGVHFASDLVRVFRGERLEYADTFDRQCRFYWPLDGDLVSLWQMRRLGRVRDYWRPGAHTNVGQSLRADAWKAGRSIRDIARSGAHAPG